jgi:hypothetical protein
MLVYIFKTEELPFELDPADTLETSAQEHRKVQDIWIFNSLGMWLLSSLFSKAHFIKKIFEQKHAIAGRLMAWVMSMGREHENMGWIDLARFCVDRKSSRAEPQASKKKIQRSTASHSLGQVVVRITIVQMHRWRI